MAKNAVYRPITPFQFNSNIELKKLSILFDKIYIENPAAPKLKPFELLDKKIAINEGIKLLYTEAKMYEYLHENGIIEEYSKIPIMKNSRLTEEESKYILNHFEKLKQAISQNKLKEFYDDNFEQRYLSTLVIEDIMARIEALELSQTHDSEFYPILKSDTLFQQNGKKSQIVYFILNNIPEPEVNTPWEKIIDFRKDTDVKNKYLKLISWINHITLSNLSVNDIKEEYETLYSDYIKAFNYHNMKYNNSMLQVLVPAAAAFFIGEPYSGIKLASDYISMKLKSVTILEDESKLPGKEIAYIYAAKQNFSNTNE
jgi:hypothetical protein